MKLIEKIEIKYFRSFGDKSVKIVSLTDLNIFSGSNDVGKSNILKALNLFFNDIISIDEKFELKKDLSFLQVERSRKRVEKKKTTRTEEDPYVSQRDLFVSVKIFFNRSIGYSKSTTPEKFWVQKKWDKNGFSSQNSNIQTAYKKKNGETPTQKQAAALQGQLTQFLNSINFEYIPAVKDRKFLQYLFKKLQRSLFERDDSFQKFSKEMDDRIADTTKDLFQEFKDKTGVDAEFSIPESLVDFFTTINVATENGISLYSRGDGIQARFIPAILNEISKGKKYVIWGFEEPENSYEYRNAKLLADDFLCTYSLKKQIFITSHTKEFLSLIKGNEDRVSLHRVYTTLKKGSLVESYKKDKGFDKSIIQQAFWNGAVKQNKAATNVLNNIFEDIGFLETDQYVIKDLQNQLKMQRKILEESGMQGDKQDRINNRLINEIEKNILDKEALEDKIREYEKPILYIEDKYDQIYKIAFLKIRKIDCNEENFEKLFMKHAPFIIRRGSGAKSVAGRLRSSNNDGYEDKKIIGLFDFDKEGRENFYNLKKESFWSAEVDGELRTGYFKKRNDHPCFYAMLLPIPQDLEHLASLDWAGFVSYVEIENLLSSDFLEKNKFVKKQNCPAGEYLKINERKKGKMRKNLFKLTKNDFENFRPLFDKIEELFNI